jgi:hypothetical protein
VKRVKKNVESEKRVVCVSGEKKSKKMKKCVCGKSGRVKRKKKCV